VLHLTTSIEYSGGWNNPLREGTLVQLPRADRPTPIATKPTLARHWAAFAHKTCHQQLWLRNVFLRQSSMKLPTCSYSNPAASVSDVPRDDRCCSTFPGLPDAVAHAHITLTSFEFLDFGLTYCFAIFFPRCGSGKY
jgi:hypothetical protein